MYHTMNYENEPLCFPTFLSGKRKVYETEDKIDAHRTKICSENLQLSENVMRSKFPKSLKAQSEYFNNVFHEKKNFIMALKNFNKKGSLLLPKIITLDFKKVYKLNNATMKFKIHKEVTPDAHTVAKQPGKFKTISDYISAANTKPLGKLKEMIRSNTDHGFSSKLHRMTAPCKSDQRKTKDMPNFRFKKLSLMIFNSYRSIMSEEEVPKLLKFNKIGNNSKKDFRDSGNRKISKFDYKQDEENLYFRINLESLSLKKAKVSDILKTNYATSFKVTEPSFRNKNSAYIQFNSVYR